MIPASGRQQAVELIAEASASGCRLVKACEELGVSIRTYQRWTQGGGVKSDGRPEAVRPVPANKLSEEERAQIIRIVLQPEYKSLPPSQIVPALADQGLYKGSESSFYRLLREMGLQHHRGRHKARESRPLNTHKASGPNEVWCWDISWIPGPAKGVFYYLYLILDLYSRKAVFWDIHDEESSDHASELIHKACLREKTAGRPLVLHSDNGSPMKGETMLEMLHKLGVTKSFSRPRVSNDNAYSEAMFRTVKYRPEYPYQGFGTLDAAREWMVEFIHWYNHEHKHSGLKFISPIDRHSGKCAQIMEQRKAVYRQAKEANPSRWSGNTRNWDLPSEVWLNPERAT